MIPLWILGLVIVAEIAIGALLYVRSNKQRTYRYHIKVKSARGVVTKLMLNREQYEHFQAFLSGADGIFEIGDDRNKMHLERRYVAAVEVRMR